MCSQQTDGWARAADTARTARLCQFGHSEGHYWDENVYGIVNDIDNFADNCARPFWGGERRLRGCPPISYHGLTCGQPERFLLLSRTHSI